MTLKKINYIVLAAGALVTLVGYFLMSGGSSTSESFDPEIFSDMRIKVAPIVCVVGFVIMGAGVMIRKKD